MKKIKFATQAERDQFIHRLLERYLTTGQRDSRQERFQLRYLWIAKYGGRVKLRETEARVAKFRPPAMQALVAGVKALIKKERKA